MSSYNLNQFDTTMYMLWSIEFISLCAKPDRTHVLCTWVLWVFAWASKPRVDKFTWKHLNFCDDSLFFVNNTQARRQGNSRGFTRTPFLASKRFYIHRSTVHFECPTVWNWSSSLDAIENHRRPHNQRGMRAYKLFTPLRWRTQRNYFGRSRVHQLSS